jgi:hypothetical protein
VLWIERTCYRPAVGRCRFAGQILLVARQISPFGSDSRAIRDNESGTGKSSLWTAQSSLYKATTTISKNHADVVGAISVLERGCRFFTCGDSVQQG